MAMLSDLIKVCVYNIKWIVYKEFSKAYLFLDFCDITSITFLGHYQSFLVSEVEYIYLQK